LPAKKTTDDYFADIMAEAGDNQNRLAKLIDNGSLLHEMVFALDRAMADPKVQCPAIERAIEKWRNETDPPRWPNKIGDTTIRTYRKTKYGI
jgi:hypothetical protein